MLIVTVPFLVTTETGVAPESFSPKEMCIVSEPVVILLFCYLALE